MALKVDQDTEHEGLWRRGFEPPGPKAEGWIFSDAQMAFIIGPYGSAKTTCGGKKALRIAMQQHPSTNDGIRKALITCVRPNYRRMEDTLIKSVKDFFGEDGQWNGPSNGPQDYFLRVHERGEIIHLHMIFRAFMDMAIESFVRGFQPTSWWVNEFDELPRGALGHMASRTGRYKLSERPKDLPPVKYCRVFGDSNMPDLDNWAHDVLLKQPDAGVEIFLQPSGFDPAAENIQNLRLIDPDYYENMAARLRKDNGEWAVKRFIENKAGYTPHGSPVYIEFNDSVHLAPRTLTPDPMRQLVIGVDQGGQTACAITQKARTGTVLVLGEVVPEPGDFIGGEEMGRRLARYLAEQEDFEKFLRQTGLKIVIDPAGAQRNATNKSGEETRNFINEFRRGFSAEAGFTPSITIGRTQILKKRIGAIKKLMRTPTITGGAGILFHPRCRTLLRGCAGGYRYNQVQGKPGEYHPEPDKGFYSNVHDALQYAGLEHVHELTSDIANSNYPYAEIMQSQWAAQTPGEMITHGNSINDW